MCRLPWELGLNGVFKAFFPWLNKLAKVDLQMGFTGFPMGIVGLLNIKMESGMIWAVDLDHFKL